MLQAARGAKAEGATRFCMGAAWREPKDRDIDHVEEMVREVKALGMETCVTLGMLAERPGAALKDAGLDYYNHNLDTAPEFYENIISTRDYQDRLDTLGRVRGAGMKVCCGGIVGMGETRAAARRADRAAGQHAALPGIGADQPPGAGAGHAAVRQDALDPLEFVRTIAVARITMPKARGAAVGRPRTAGRRGAGDVLHGRRQFDLLRRQAAHDRQPGRRGATARCWRAWA